MKEIRKPIRKEFPPIRLYLDDIDAIYEVLKKNCGTVTIETDKYEISDTTQLKDIGVNEIHTMIFKCQKPYIDIELRPFEATIYISEDSTVNRGILSQLEETLKKCERKIIRILVSTPSSFVAGALLAVALIQISDSLEGWLAILLTIITLSVFALFFVRSYRLSIHQHSTIILSERRQTIGFSQRNKDRIIVGIIVAAISVSLTVLAFKILGGL